MIHPDKCDEPCAATAFDALKKAYETLTDMTKRKNLDDRRSSDKDREEFKAWLKNEREKAIWRKQRGESRPDDDDILSEAFDIAPNDSENHTREEWMKELPPERKAAHGPVSASVTAFSKEGLMVRDQKAIDDWTRNPKDAKPTLFLEQSENRMIAAAAQKEREDNANRRMIQQYNEESGRQKTLLEEHQEREKNKKKSKKMDKAGDGDDDGTGWTYKPFNREIDLKLRKIGQMDPKEAMNRAGGGLGSRFGSGGMQ